nr:MULTISPECIES: DNA repair protein RadC [Zoogloeaceae]
MGMLGTADTVLAHRLNVARELLLRELREQMRNGPLMTSPQILRDWLRLYCAKLENEVFLVLYLDAQHRLIEAEELFRGTLTQTSVYPREVVKGALARNAAALAVAHNHPSGEAEPSRADEMLTQTLKSALSLVDVRVIDHFVVAGDRVISFAERGLI